MLKSKVTHVLTLLLITILCSCEKQDVKPSKRNWEVTFANWESYNIGTNFTPLWVYWLHIKVKNNTSRTAEYIGINIDLKTSDGTIKKRGIYTYTHLIAPNEEHDFDESDSGIRFLDQAEYDNVKDLNYSYENPTVWYYGE